MEKLLNPFDKIIKGLDIKIEWIKVDNNTDTSDWWEYKSYNVYNYISEEKRKGLTDFSNIFKIDVNINAKKIEEKNLLIKMKDNE